MVRSTVGQSILGALDYAMGGEDRRLQRDDQLQVTRSRQLANQAATREIRNMEDAEIFNDLLSRGLITPVEGGGYQVSDVTSWRPDQQQAFFRSDSNYFRNPNNPDFEFAGIGASPNKGQYVLLGTGGRPITENATSDPNDPVRQFSAAEINDVAQSRLNSMLANAVQVNPGSQQVLTQRAVNAQVKLGSLRQDLLDSLDGITEADPNAGRTVYEAFSNMTYPELLEAAEEQGLDLTQHFRQYGQPEAAPQVPTIGQTTAAPEDPPTTGRSIEDIEADLAIVRDLPRNRRNIQRENALEDELEEASTTAQQMSISPEEASEIARLEAERAALLEDTSNSRRRNRLVAAIDRDLARLRAGSSSSQTEASSNNVQQRGSPTYAALVEERDAAQAALTEEQNTVSAQRRVRQLRAAERRLRDAESAIENFGVGFQPTTGRVGMMSPPPEEAPETTTAVSTSAPSAPAPDTNMDAAIADVRRMLQDKPQPTQADISYGARRAQELGVRTPEDVARLVDDADKRAIMYATAAIYAGDPAVQSTILDRFGNYMRTGSFSTSPTNVAQANAAATRNQIAAGNLSLNQAQFNYDQYADNAAFNEALRENAVVIETGLNNNKVGSPEHNTALIRLDSQIQALRSETDSRRRLALFDSTMDTIGTYVIDLASKENDGVFGFFADFFKPEGARIGVDFGPERFQIIRNRGGALKRIEILGPSGQRTENEISASELGSELGTQMLEYFAQTIEAGQEALQR